MKKLKNYFAAFVAIAAIGLTLAAQAGAFEASKAAPAVSPCYIDVTNISPNPPSPNRLEQGVTTQTVALAQVGKNATFNLDPIDSDECEGGNLFCCATVTADGLRIANVFFQP